MTEFKNIDKKANDLFDKLFVGKDSNKTKFVFGNSKKSVNFEYALQKKSCEDNGYEGTYKGTYNHAGDFFLHPSLSVEGNCCGKVKVTGTVNPDIDNDSLNVKGDISYQAQGKNDNGLNIKGTLVHDNFNFNINGLYPTNVGDNFTVKSDVAVNFLDHWTIGGNATGVLGSKPNLTKYGLKLHFQQEKNFQMTGFYDCDSEKLKQTCGFSVFYNKNTTDVGFKYSFDKCCAKVEEDENNDENKEKKSSPHVISGAVQFNCDKLDGVAKLKLNTRGEFGAAYKTNLSDSLAVTLATTCGNALKCDGHKVAVNFDFNL